MLTPSVLITICSPAMDPLNTTQVLKMQHHAALLLQALIRAARCDDLEENLVTNH